MSEKPRILVADDQADVVEALRLLLKGGGFLVDAASSPDEVVRLMEKRPIDALLMDLNYTRDTTSGREGMDLLGRVRQLDPDLPVVVMTAWGSVDGAVEAMRRGAKDYVEKPWDNARLIATIRTQLELGTAKRHGQRLAKPTVTATSCLCRSSWRSPRPCVRYSTSWRALGRRAPMY